MQSLYHFFKSAKLAVVLLIVIAIASILATLIPQNRELQFYYHTYPPAFTWLVLNTQFNIFFRSFFFLTTIVLFTVNLSVCAIDRIVKEFRNKRRKRFGPDFIHIGLLILLAGAIVTFSGRREVFRFMANGDSLTLAGNFRIELKSFEFLTYDNGRPKDWISTVDVYHDDERIIDSFPIEVNKPLKVGRIEAFQSSYADEPRITLVAADGTVKKMGPNKIVDTGNEVLVLYGIGNDADNPSQLAAQIEIWRDGEVTGSEIVVKDSQIAGLKVERIEVLPVTGLTFVLDPGFLPVLIGFILCIFGLILTYYQKIGDKEI